MAIQSEISPNFAGDLMAAFANLPVQILRHALLVRISDLREVISQPLHHLVMVRGMLIDRGPEELISLALSVIALAG